MPISFASPDEGAHVCGDDVSVETIKNQHYSRILTFFAPWRFVVHQTAGLHLSHPSGQNISGACI